MIEKKRAENYSTFFEWPFKKNERVLDVGGGDGYLGKLIKEKYRINITNLEIVKFKKTFIKTVYYKGDNFPFDNKSIDWVIFFSVLHHSQDQIRLLSEAKRIAKKGIIIHEDLVIGERIHDTYTKMYDFLANRWKGVPCPFTFHSVEEWQKIFKELSIKEVYLKLYKKRKIFLKLGKMFIVLKVDQHK